MIVSTRWNPRGEPTWPDWKKAKPGTRVRSVRNPEITGVFVRASGNPHGPRVKNKHQTAVIDWDDRGFGVQRGRVVAPAFDLEPISDESSDV